VLPAAEFHQRDVLGDQQPARIGLNPAQLLRTSNQASLNRLVAGGRYELYSNYALEIQAVAASIDVPVDLRTNGFLKKVERDGPHYEH
jgi:hypothetical protein